MVLTASINLAAMESHEIWVLWNKTFQSGQFCSHVGKRSFLKGEKNNAASGWNCISNMQCSPPWTCVMFFPKTQGTILIFTVSASAGSIFFSALGDTTLSWIFSHLSGGPSQAPLLTPSPVPTFNVEVSLGWVLGLPVFSVPSSPQGVLHGFPGF